MTGNLATGLSGARIGARKLNSMVHYIERATTKTERAETIPSTLHIYTKMLFLRKIYSKMMIANNSENQRTDSWLPF
jgi:hypothetical protein